MTQTQKDAVALIGTVVNYNANPGDTVKLPCPDGKSINLRITDTFANTIRAEDKDGFKYGFLYRQLIEQKVTFVAVVVK